MKHILAMLVFCCGTLGADAADLMPSAGVRDQYRAHAHKPTLPVSIHAVVPADITPGQPVTFNVDVASALEEGELQLTFTPMDSLLLVAPTQPSSFSLTAGGLRTTQAVTVIAPEEGRYSLTVQISHESNGKVRSVSRAITFVAGDRARVSTKSRQASGGSEPGVVSLPAQESIRR